MREGPHVIRECIGCKHLGSQSYRVQGDSGIDYWCNHPSRNDTNRTIGDTTCKTPEWCPFLQSAPEPVVAQTSKDVVSGWLRDYAEILKGRISDTEISRKDWEAANQRFTEIVLYLRATPETGCGLCATGMNSFTDPDTGNRMHARNGVVTVCTAPKANTRPDDPNALFRWICPKCRTVNAITDEVCLGGTCGTRRPQ